MISIFDYQDPVNFLQSYIEKLPARSRRGIYNRIAQAAGVFPSYLSQIFSNKRQFNLDQALGVAEFLELKRVERRYFLLMVERTRAATARLQEELSNQLSEARASQDRIMNRISYDEVQLSDEEQTRFYSSWIFAAVRLAVALPGMHDAVSIAGHLQIPLKQVEKALEFLIKTGLCREEEGRIAVGPTHTHLDAESPHIVSHHRAWRLKAMEHQATLNSAHELSYSLVACLSRKDALKIRQYLLSVVSEVRQITDPSPSEKIYALNLDWLQIC